MAKMNDIRFLARETAKEVSGSPRDWMRYLDTASRLYRYPFADTLLIHAQRPDATACAELEVWNEKMRRWVNRGAKGIALIDDTGPRRVLRYVFDVSDTHPVRGGRTPYLWRLKEDQREMLLNHLTDTYGLNGEDAPDLPSALRQVAEDIFNGDMFQDSSGTCSCSGFCTPFICWHVRKTGEKRKRERGDNLMRKKRKYLYGILVVITMLLCFPSSVFAQEKVDISREASVKVYFEADGNGFADVEFCIYRIADVSEEGNFTLSGDFLDYPISLGNLDSSKWRALAQTLEAYIARDGIKAFQVKRTGKMGEAVFEQIPTGLYLVTGDSVRQGRNIYTPEPFLVSLPTVDQNNGQWLYDAEMFCKYENSNVQENTVTRKVLKLWENDEAGVQRPEKITIQLLKNEEVYDTVILNAENNWSYSWEGLESDARWHVTEYETPEGNAYIGTLEIPALGISLPVMSEWGYPKLRIAPCRYSGSVYQDNLVIAAHNYSRHFGKIGSLIDGDQILFTDVDGNHFLYEVAEIQILESTDVEKMLDEQWDLNLFTCTLGGKTRMTVRCEKLLYDG